MVWSTMQNFRTHPEWQALVTVVGAARRGDDLPRLVAADWLEYHGRPEYAAYMRHEVNPHHYPILKAVRGRMSESAWLDYFRRVLELEERHGVVTGWGHGRVVAVDVPWGVSAVWLLLSDVVPKIKSFGLCTADPVDIKGVMAWGERTSSIMPDTLGPNLPPPVFARLTGGRLASSQVRMYKDEESARAALSRALRAISHQ